MCSDSAIYGDVGDIISQGLMCSQEGSLARIFPTQDWEQESTESGAGYGVNISASLANYDPESRSWKTSQLCLSGEWDEFWETWPASGMMRNGVVYLLPPLVRTTSESECGLWPTPTASDFKGASWGCR